MNTRVSYLGKVLLPGLMAWGICLGSLLAGASFDLRQVRNGPETAPQDPGMWVGGNAGPANAHYFETQSIPYRLAMADLALGPHRLIIEWDTKQNGRHAIDFVTHYDRLIFHDLFASHQIPETIDPLAGLPGPWSQPEAFPIPAPHALETPVAGQPAAAFLNLPPSERVLTIWNGVIKNAVYVRQDELGESAATTRLQIDFIAQAADVVMAWGGHIGAQFDWGVGQSATSIHGAPYHTRVISLDGSGGRQDVSLQTMGLVPPPPCHLTGPGLIHSGDVVIFEAVRPSFAPGVAYEWTLINNEANALISGPTNETSVGVIAGTGGRFTVQLTVGVGEVRSDCQLDVEAIATAPVVICPEDMTVACAGPEGTPVSYTILATNYLGEPLLVSCDPPSGSLFAPGLTEVVCRAVDERGQTAECRFQVAVVDEEPPRIHCPDTIYVSETASGAGVGVADFSLPEAMDHCDPAPRVECDPMPGATLPVGETTVRCTVTDASGQTATCEFVVKVVPIRIATTTTADAGPGSLRQALLDANAAPGLNIIEFNLPGSAPHTIHLLTPLPQVGDDTMIDGASQPGFVLKPVVELNGQEIPFDDAGEPPSVGLSIQAGGVTVRGLSLSGFDVGLVLEGPGSNIVQGNYIGLGAFGEVTLSNRGPGLVIRSPGNLVGGAGPGEGNVISGNGGGGIRVESQEAHHNLIRSNLIGVTPDGERPLGNQGDGVFLGEGTYGNVIGGFDAGQGNQIAFNSRHGVAAEGIARAGQSILGNSIHKNEGLGIDLGADGVSPNAADDDSHGPEVPQRYPENMAALQAGDSTVFSGTIHSVPGQKVHVEIFTSEDADPSGFGEGRRWVGGTTVEVGEDGYGQFAVSFPVVVSLDQFVTATATDAAGNTSEFSAAVPVDGPPLIVAQPISQNVFLGDPAVFCVEVLGSRPLTYQWRLNGANIVGATQSCYSVESAQLQNGGTYTVLVLNRYGVAISQASTLGLNLPIREIADDLGERVVINEFSGMLVGLNGDATLEGGEPDHAGKPGGSSAWYSWTAPATGIATVTTVGSTFDTLLAVYEGNSFSNLVLVAEDEDRGGFFTSAIRLNVVEGLEYLVAVDGFGGASGKFVLNWELEPTQQLLPVIHVQPESGTVAPGAAFTFRVVADGSCADAHHDCRHPNHDHHPQHDDEVPLFYQWLHDSVPISGANSDTYTVTGADESKVGAYSVLVSTPFRTLESVAARLQINETESTYQEVLTADKFLDAALTPSPLRVGGFLALPPDPAESELGGGGGSVVRGFTGTQVFSTQGSSTEAGETLICGLVGGASEWITVIAEATGMLHLDTQGSTFDTAMAVLARSVTNAPFLDVIDCNDNAALPLLHSQVEVPVVAGQTNFVVLDGVNGASGILRLNYSLIVEARFSFIRQLPDGSAQFQVVGRPNLNLAIETSSNLRQWSPMVTTNAPTGVIDFVDPAAAGPMPRFYRARLLP